MIEVKRLLYPEQSPLVTDEENFLVYIIIFDNLTDEYGEIMYDNYPILKLEFKGGTVDNYLLIQDGRYVYPDFEGWSKKMLAGWLRDYEEREYHPSPPYKDSYELYRAILEVK